MTDNFSTIREYMVKENIPLTEKESGDLFFEIMLIRRGKDHPDLPSANYTFKSYYIDSIEKYDKCVDEIKACCSLFGLRAYVSVNVKSKEAFIKYMAYSISENIYKNDYKKPWKIMGHVYGKLGASNNDRWIVDIDDCNEETNYFLMACKCIRLCESRWEDPIITTIGTKSGIHIITHPFNLQRFNQMCQENNIEAPDVKKNHITLLYEDL